MTTSIDDSESFLDELAEMIENMEFQVDQTYPTDEIRLQVLESCIRQWREDLIFIHKDLMGFNVWDDTTDYISDWTGDDD